MLTGLSWVVLMQTQAEQLRYRRRGYQASTDRSFPIHVGGQSCRFSSPVFRWWWQLWMHPVGSSTRPFLLISLSEREFSWVSKKPDKNVAVWPPPCALLCLSSRWSKGECAGTKDKDVRRRNREMLLVSLSRSSTSTWWSTKVISGPDIKLHFLL